MSDSNTTETEAEKIARLESQLSEARSQAAKYRVEKRTVAEDLRAQLEADHKAELEAAQAKTKADQETLAAEFNKSQATVARLQAALTTVFDEKTVERVVEMASRLVGNTPDELKADAERAKALFGLESKSQPTKAPAVDPSQGLGNQSAAPLNGDPLLQAVTGILNKRGR